MNRFLFVCLGLSAGAAGVACGLSPDAGDVFSGQGGASTAAVTGVVSSGTTTGSIGNGGASSAATSGSATATGGPTTTTGPTTTGTGTSVATTGSGTTSSTSASSAIATTTTTVTSSSTGTGSTVQVYCNNAACAFGEICCFNPTGPGDHCGLGGQCENGFVELHCNGPEDCPGQLCCGTLSQATGQPVYKGIACDPACGAQNRIVICSQADPTCPPNTQCAPSTILGAGYFVCR